MPKSLKVDIVRVAVIDDHPLMRNGVVQALRAEHDLDVVGEGESAADAIDLAERLLPDVMLVDINMPGGGLAALTTIADRCPAVACIVITVREDEETVARALRIGARGYVLKGISGRELARTIRSVHQGEVYITPALATRLLAAEETAIPAAASDARWRLNMLTEREIEILKLIAQGMINKQIGAELDLSEKTVKHYVTNILQKLQVRNRLEAALIAQQELKLSK
jgi:two-component system, NarL family, nitrate/nitrite response regulator NarL